MFARSGLSCAFLAASIAVVPASAQRPTFGMPREPVAAGTASYPPRVVASADFDGDGDVDLATVDGLRMNDGSGRFAVHAAALPGAATARTALVGDFDGDGDADLLLRDLTSVAQLLLNAGTGAFTPLPNPYVGGGSPAAISVPATAPVVVGDFDGDGMDDLALSQPSTTPFLRAVGGGFFASGAAAFPFASSGSPLDAHDFDGDGDDELLFVRRAPITNAPLDVVHVAFASGVATVSAPIVAVNAPGLPPYARGDLDGDGSRDDCVLYAPPTAGGVAQDVVALRGPGGFTASAATHAGAVKSYAACDVDGDGVEDVVRFTNGAAALHPVAGGALGAATGSVAADAPEAVSGDPSGPYRSADFDGDGDRDLLVRVRSAYWRVLFAGAGALRDPLDDDVPHGVVGRRTLPVDFDGDGDRDLCAPYATFDASFAPTGTFAFAVGRNDGAGRFAALGPPVAFGAFPKDDGAYAVADFDGDGDEDVVGGETCRVTEGPFPSGTYALLSDGAGGLAKSFVPWPAPAASGGRHRGAAVLDADGDGDADVALVGHVPAFGVASWFGLLVNDGSGAFTVVDQISPPAPTDVAAADLDGDGDVDLAMAAAGGDPYVAWNVGGTFSLATLPAAASADTVAAGDLDGDGDVDLVFGRTRYLNQGGGVFAAGSSATTWTGVYWGAVLGDFDLDGESDLVYAGSFLRGLGGGAYAADQPLRPVPETPTFFTGDRPYHAEDFDGDGDLDLLELMGGVQRNLTRGLVGGAYARPGRFASLRSYGAPGEAVALFVSGALLPTPAPLPPFGLLHLDPASTAAFATFGLDATGYFELGGALAADPNLVGVVLHWQSVHLGAGRLSNVLTTVVEGF